MTPDEGEKRAKELNVMFIETSAKAGHNVCISSSLLFYFIVLFLCSKGGRRKR